MYPWVSLCYTGYMKKDNIRLNIVLDPKDYATLEAIKEYTGIGNDIEAVRASIRKYPFYTRVYTSSEKILDEKDRPSSIDGSTYNSNQEALKKKKVPTGQEIDDFLVKFTNPYEKGVWCPIHRNASLLSCKCGEEKLKAWFIENYK